MEKIYIVYIHTNKINNKKYVGMTRMSLKERWKKGTNYFHNEDLTNDVRKYGQENFDHEVYASGLTREEASELEKELIKKFDTTNPEYGYNLDSGGLNPKHAESTKKKMREKRLGYKQSEETKEKLRIASTGNKNCLGRKQTEEAKRKNREAHLNKTHVCSQEAKDRIMMSHKNRIEVVCVELNMTFPSISAGARYTNCSEGTISGVLRGVGKTAGGYHWERREITT